MTTAATDAPNDAPCASPPPMTPCSPPPGRCSGSAATPAGLDGVRTRKEIVYGITSLPTDLASPAHLNHYTRLRTGTAPRAWPPSAT